jgi:hypothetical protein
VRRVHFAGTTAVRDQQRKGIGRVLKPRPSNLINHAASSPVNQVEPGRPRDPPRNGLAASVRDRFPRLRTRLARNRAIGRIPCPTEVHPPVKVHKQSIEPRPDSLDNDVTPNLRLNADAWNGMLSVPYLSEVRHRVFELWGY